MKLSEIIKLRRLAKIKADAEKTRFGAINAEQAALRDAAARHAAIAARPFEPAVAETTGGDLSAYGPYLRRHDRAARERLSDAEALETEKEARRSALARSLGEEAAWRRLQGGATAERRKKANDAEENGRSDAIASAASAARRLK